MTSTEEQEPGKAEGAPGVPQLCRTDDSNCTNNASTRHKSAAAGAIDADVSTKRQKLKTDNDKRSESMPITFEERLSKKLASERERGGGGGRGAQAQPARAVFDDRMNDQLKRKLDADGKRNANANERGGGTAKAEGDHKLDGSTKREKMRTTKRSESLPITYEELMRQKLVSKRERCRGAQAQAARAAFEDRMNDQLKRKLEADRNMNAHANERGGDTAKADGNQQLDGNTLKHQSATVYNSRSESLPTTFEDRLKRKLSSEEQQRAGSGSVSTIEADQRPSRKLEPGTDSDNGAGVNLKPSLRTESSQLIHERSEEDHSDHSANGETGKDELGEKFEQETSTWQDYLKEDSDCSFCSDELQVSVLERQVLRSTVVLEEGSDFGATRDDSEEECSSVQVSFADRPSGPSCNDQVLQAMVVASGSTKDTLEVICLENVLNVFAELQQFKEENGHSNMPISHPSLVNLRNTLSSQDTEPLLVQDREHMHDWTASTPRRGRSSQHIQHSVHGNQTQRAGTRRRRRSRFTTMAVGWRSRLNFHDDPVTATLVEEGEVVMAEPIGLFDRKWKRVTAVMCTSMTLLGVVLTLSLTNVIDFVRQTDSTVGTFQPSLSPTFDPRSTLEMVQDRGYILCGMTSETFNSKKGFRYDLCRAVAAVVVGDPDKFDGVPLTAANRWESLNDRKVDLLVLGDTHTIERETGESSTGSGFTFSSVFSYDGMVYFGNETFVNCAELQHRYDGCSLKICVRENTTHYDFVEASFPSANIMGLFKYEDMIDMLFNESCNVAAYEKSIILAESSNELHERNFIVGNKLMTKEPIAFVTRNNDREFSDIVNWVVQALYFGEEQGLTKDPTRCQNSNVMSANVSDLRFMNAVYCVGNYGEIFGGSPESRGMNQINNGTGVLYAIPFGELRKDKNLEISAESMLTKIMSEGVLNCGVVVAENFDGNIMETDKILGMHVGYCQTLAAALFIGDARKVNITTYSKFDNSSYIALANGAIDVFVGGTVRLEYDFESYTPPLQGFQFSAPYYYGNESPGNAVSFYSMATREDDALFASFVNCIVLATIYAQENNIQRERSRLMPLVSIFGSDLNWALRDAIAFSGSYDELYIKNFGKQIISKVGLNVLGPNRDAIMTANILENKAAEGKGRGRNMLNEGGPMHHSFPGLTDSR